jgi:hypothetical protein
MEAKIVTTNLALDNADSLRRSATGYQDLRAATGYDGMEFHPLRSYLRLQLSRGNPEAHALIISYHQSFRGESLARMAQLALRGDIAELARCAPAFGVLPRRDKSIDDLARLQARVTEQKPIVVFPNSSTGNLPPVDFDKYRDTFDGLLVQPTPELFTDWDIATNDPRLATTRLARQLGHRGLGLCLDFAHWMSKSKDGQKLPNWEDAFPLLARPGLIDEIHIGPNRNDVLPDQDGRQLRQILDGNGQSTVIGRQIQAVRENLPEGQPFPYTVIEMTAHQARQAFNVTPDAQNGEHDLIVSALKEMIVA